ncbi:hypothetical protein NL489_26500, partial [Klebsiella pneumoniae]|nr:hypothetical protein [Klebsiella pneumoniae]
ARLPLVQVPRKKQQAQFSKVFYSTMEGVSSDFKMSQSGINTTAYASKRGWKQDLAFSYGRPLIIKQLQDFLWVLWLASSGMGLLVQVQGNNKYMYKFIQWSAKWV